jgi:hypothetical protein
MMLFSGITGLSYYIGDDTGKQQILLMFMGAFLLPLDLRVM